MNANIECLQKALEKLSLSYESIGGHDDTVRLKSNGLCFINSTTPFNSESVSRLLLDKSFTHDVVGKVVRMPKIISYFDPHRTDWDSYKKFQSISDISKNIEIEFGYSVIIKPNKGSRAKNVFISNSVNETTSALECIFKNDRGYDYIALAEECVIPHKEFCLMIANGLPEFAYEKVIEPIQEGDTSILRSKHTKAVIVPIVRRDELFKFIEPILKVIPSTWFSADIIEDKEGSLFLIELNSSPGFGYFVRDNGKEIVIDMYEKVIKKFISQ